MAQNLLQLLLLAAVVALAAASAAPGSDCGSEFVHLTAAPRSTPYVHRAYRTLNESSAPTVDYTLSVFAQRSPAAVGDNDDSRRFARSAEINNIKINWLPGTAFSPAAMRAALESVKARADVVVMFLADADDVIIAGERVELTKKLEEADAQILFAATSTCEGVCLHKSMWPTNYLIPSLNMLQATSFIGFAPAVYALMEKLPVEGEVQEALSKLFVDDKARQSLGLQLDYAQSIFANLDGYHTSMSEAEMALTFEYRGQADPRVQIVATGTYPAVLRGNSNYMLLNQIGNYVPMRYEPVNTCRECREHMLPYQMFSKAATTPTVYMVFTVEDVAPFLEFTLKGLSALEYPRTHMNLMILLQSGNRFPNYERNKLKVNAWLAAVQPAYSSARVVEVVDMLESVQEALNDAKALNMDYFFMVDALSRFDDKKTLQHLIRLNQTAVAPMLLRPELNWANFWGATNEEVEVDTKECVDEHYNCAHYARAGECSRNPGWMSRSCRKSCNLCKRIEAGSLESIGYVRSMDYLLITSNEQRGVWAVPFVFGTVLFNRQAIAVLQSAFAKHTAAKLPLWDVHMLICQTLQQRHFHTMVTNMIDYGHYINTERYQYSKLHPDLLMLPDNPEDWAEKYLNEAYHAYADRNISFLPGCTDVFKVPLFSPKFASDLVAECEHFGKWSGGQTYDPRLSGGYEPVPTRDIHLNQLDLQDTWYHVLTRFLRPVTSHHYLGYTLEGRTTLDFVVKYDAKGQAALRPHHDASTVTLNVALNQGGVEYQGGGTHFLRQNCTVKDTPPGWGAIFPGRLTHQHEGLQTTQGTRYILVSFIDQ